MSQTKHFGVNRIFKLALLEKRRLAWGLLVLVIGSSMLLIYPQIIRSMVDGALQTGDQAALRRSAWLVFVVFLVQALAGAGRYYLFTSAGERIVTALRQKVYDAIIHQDIAFFDQRRTGELMSRLSADATVLQNAVSVNISMLTRNFGAAVGGLVLLVYTSPVLTLGLLIAIPPLALGTAAFGQKIRKIARRVQDALAATASVAEESISGIRTVRAFSQEGFESGRYHKALAETLSLAMGKIRLITAFTAGASLLGYLGVVGVLYYGAYLVIDEQMSIGDLTSFLLYTLTVAVSVASLASLWTDFMAATGAGRRIFEILDQPNSKGETLGQKLEHVAGEISFETVHFRYPSRADIEVLRGISFSVAPGEHLALVGPSGSGKSTIAALLTRFYNVNLGAIRVDHHDITTLDASWLRQKIGIVSQDPVLMSASIAANIRYGRPDADQSAVVAAAKAANAHEFIESFPDGYQTIVGERGIQLSGGQRQRVAIARAMLKDPRILILDEATSALDAESEKLVQEALERLMQGRTSLVIAHRLATVRKADRVVVIDRGLLVESGDHQSLMQDKQGLYYKLVQLQTLVDT